MAESDRPRAIDVGVRLGQPGQFDDESFEWWKEWLKAPGPPQELPLVDQAGTLKVSFSVRLRIHSTGHKRVLLTG